MLTVASLLSILLLMLHFTDDILREGGIAVNGTADLIAIVILALLLCGTLLLAEHRSGYIIMLLASLFSMGMPVLHMSLAKNVYTNEAARARGDFLFVFTLLALGVLGLLCFILSVRGLWKREWSLPRASSEPL